jgi:hypothetical protein
MECFPDGGTPFSLIFQFEYLVFISINYYK